MGFYDLNSAGPHREPREADPDFLDEKEASDWLRDHAEEWVPRLFPQGKIDRATHELRVADITGRAPRDKGSCVIQLRGPNAACFYDFDGGDKGGPLSALGKRLGLSRADLFAEIKRMMGSQPASSAGAASNANPKRDRSAQIAAEIAHILRHATPIAGTLAETYLRSRGITGAIDCLDLLFNGNTTHWERKTGEPALIARLRYPGGSEAGIHRIYLKSDGSWHDDKKMLGPCDGAVCMLAPYAARYGVGEGIETTLAAMELYGIPGAACASADGLRKFGDYLAVNPGCPIRQLEIFADRGNAGQDAAQYLARCARAVGIDVVIRLPIGDDDFADDLKNGRGRSEETLPLPEQAPVLAIEPIWTPPEKSEADKARAERRAIIPGWQVALKSDNSDLISGLVPKHGMGLIVGEYGTGKSFFALDFAKHLASGEEWFGRQVEKIGVIYVCAEAGETFDRRIVAHHLERGKHALGFIFSSIDFGKELSIEVSELSSRIVAANADNLLGAPIKMVFVDTLARSGLKNENDSEAMNNLITNCDLLGEITGAIVVGIHHAGWTANRSRGHSSLPAAVDFEITLDGKTDIHTAEITKSRDGTTGEKMSFELVQVEVGERADGSKITTCIVKPIATEATQDERPKKKLNQDQKIALDALRRVVNEGGIYPSFGGFPGTRRAVKADTWRTAHLAALENPADKEADNFYRQMRRVREWLQANGIVAKKDDFVWPVSMEADKADNGRTT